MPKTDKHINDVFDNLDKWRHLPNYQLERRADIFFALYLPRILEQKFGHKNWSIIPELPVKKQGSNRSWKIDYFAIPENMKCAVFIELKTDMNSIKKEQVEKLIKAKNEGLRFLLTGVLQISGISKARGKYAELLRQLEEMGLLKPYSKRELEVAAKLPQNIHVLYIQPKESKSEEQQSSFEYVTFKEFVETVSQHQDSLSKRFACSLSRWGSNKPQCRVGCSGSHPALNMKRTKQ